MNASKPIRSCDDVQLDVLLFGEEDSNEFQVMSAHVESCPLCRNRLTETAEHNGECTEIIASLRECQAESGKLDSFEDFAALGSHSGTSSQRSIKLDFLSPPSHPEMLGRLGRYEIEQIIGSGGMGIVLKGFDTQLHRPVAIKVLAPHSGAQRRRPATIRPRGPIRRLDRA